jgi:hypothetical protein
MKIRFALVLTTEMTKALGMGAVILLFPTIAFTQSTLIIVRDTITTVHARTWPRANTQKRALILSDGKIIETYSHLKLGMGSLPDGSFQFIIKPSDDIDRNLRYNTPLKELYILEIRKKGSKKSGYKYELLCDDKYIVQIDEALASYEVIP